jgi:hypothetical protein
LVECDYCIVILNNGLIWAVWGLILIDIGLKGVETGGNGDDGGLKVDDYWLILLDKGLKGFEQRIIL